MTIPSTRKVRALSRLLGLSALGLALASCSDEVTGPSDIMGGAWRLRTMTLAGGSPFTPSDPSRYTVEFKNDDQIGLVADCNACGGSYSVSNGTLSVPPLACTLVACAGPEGGQFAGIIEGSSSIRKDGDDELEIQSSEGRLLLER
jgi:heat shock protein HslJ